MNISFSTICPVNAKKYLYSDAYKYLPVKAKEVALKYVGEGVLRVQDPLMYSKPCLEITSQKIFDEIMEAVNSEPSPPTEQE